jgi:hypothetical protein
MIITREYVEKYNLSCMKDGKEGRLGTFNFLKFEEQVICDSDAFEGIVGELRLDYSELTVKNGEELKLTNITKLEIIRYDTLEPVIMKFLISSPVLKKIYISNQNGERIFENKYAIRWLIMHCPKLEIIVYDDYKINGTTIGLDRKQSDEKLTEQLIYYHEKCEIVAKWVEYYDDMGKPDSQEKIERLLDLERLSKKYGIMDENEKWCVYLEGETEKGTFERCCRRYREQHDDFERADQELEKIRLNYGKKPEMFGTFYGFGYTMDEMIVNMMEELLWGKSG